LKDKAKYKYFFGHFGTDHSTFGNSFDLGTITGKKTRFVPLDVFDKKVWTRVYLGDIHQHQEMNDFCRHVGSIARVDFGEENEYKGFYYLDGEAETFQTISDREFRTLEVDLMENPRITMEKFCSNVQEMDLSSSIVRLKVKMKDKDRALVGFDGIENFLMQESWNYIGKTITAVKETEDIKIDVNADFDYVKIFDKFTSAVKEDRKIPEDVFKSVTEEGKRILSEILNQ
jgi:DNA repair exonuclease SbcCD nuclease subunit